MSDKELRLSFEASAYLQTLIGRELVSSEELALVELIKNTYDAGAHKVTITIRRPSAKEPGEITVHDDGEGMTLDQFQQLFMFAGYSERTTPPDDAVRVATGEKGIGRFATDRLGKHLSVVTKTKDATAALIVEINWNDFENRRKKFHEISVPYKQEVIREFREHERGTILRITKLREMWPRKKVDSLRSTFGELLDPFNRPSNFEIDLQVPGSPDLSGPIYRAPMKGVDIEIKFEVLRDLQVRRQLRGKLFGKVKRPDLASSSAELEAVKGMRGTFLYFLKRPSKKITGGMLPGIKLYRDGFQVNPFGASGADWLGVAQKRAKRAGHAHIVPSRLFGFVGISRILHPRLRDTTSREMLLSGEAARSLVTVLREQLKLLEETIRSEITEPRWKESKTRKAAELEQSRLQTLSILSAGLAHELRQPLQSIRADAENISTRLKQLGIEDEHIKKAQLGIDQDIDRIDKNILLVAKISSGSFDDVDVVDLSSLIREQLRIVGSRYSSMGIDLQKEILTTQPAK